MTEPEEAGARQGPDRLWLVPGAEVPLLALDLPGGLRGLAREQVARRQLRDVYGLDGKGVDIRPYSCTSGPNGWTRVLVADSALVAKWRNEAPRGTRAVLPDYLGLPTAPELWTLDRHGDVVLVRLGPDDGFSAETDLARAQVKRALENAPPKAVLALGGTEDLLDGLVDEDLSVLTSAEAATRAGFLPKILGHGEGNCDLRTDPQAARLRLRRQVLPWRWPLLAGALAVGFWAATQILATQKLEQAVRDQHDVTLALVQSHFVPSGPVLDIRAQVTRAMTAAQAGRADWQARGSPLDLMARASAVIADAGADLQDLAHTAADGMSVALVVVDFSAADRLVADFRAAGLGVINPRFRVSDTTGGVRIDLRLSADPAEANE